MPEANENNPEMTRQAPGILNVKTSRPVPKPPAPKPAPAPVTAKPTPPKDK